MWNRKINKIKSIHMKHKTMSREMFRLLSYISPKWNTKALYRQKFGKKINLDSPMTLNEKVSKLKLELYGRDALVRQCADKYAVREYIEKKGLIEILNELYGVYKTVEDIEWDKLPDRFVIKWNFGCKFNLFCNDKSKLDIEDAKKQLKRWGKIDFWSYYSELQYKGVHKKMIVEKYLGSKENTLPEDYKFYCFSGKAVCVMVCCGRELGWPKFYFFDRDWNLMKINRDSQNVPEDFELPKPEGMEEAFVYADRLSASFSFVRTDLYLIDGKVIFGELTFTPSAGLDHKRLPETDLMFGAYMHI